MATLCNRCLQPIQWKQDRNDRWIKMELQGNQEHAEVCRGQPIKGSVIDLKAQITELEQKLAKATEAVASAQAGTRYWESQYRALSEKHQVFVTVQNVLNAGVAWYRAKQSRTGKTDLKLEVLKEAVIRYCEIEGKGKKKSA